MDCASQGQERVQLQGRIIVLPQLAQLRNLRERQTPYWLAGAPDLGLCTRGAIEITEK
jgi:hypothetical protein